MRKIFVNGKEIKVEKCRVSAIPFNVWWKGKQRPIEQSEEAYFASFRLAEKATVRIEYLSGIRGEIAIRPLSKGVNYWLDGNAVEFEISAEGQYVIEDGEDRNAFHLFVNKDEDLVNKYAYSTVFGKGEHFVGKVEVKSGDRIYIDDGAVVHGCFFGKGVKDVVICGYGIIDDGEEERRSMHCYEDYTNGCLKFYESSDIKVEGVILRDSAIWVCNLFDCEDVVLDGIKIVGHWKYNADGIDIVNSRRVTVKNSFIRAFDDAITIKGIVQHKEKDVEDIFVDGCVLWCGWGRTLEIGLETVARNYKNIIFKNCDLIHNSAVALDVQSGDYALIDRLLFENIRVEYQKYTLPEVIQNPEEKVYDGYEKPFIPKLISIDNPYYLINGLDYEWYDEELKKVREGKMGGLKNCIFRNITAVGETKNGELPEIFINNSEPFEMGEVVIDNLTIFGEEITKEKANLKGNKIDKVKFKG